MTAHRVGVLIGYALALAIALLFIAACLFLTVQLLKATV